LGPRALSLVGVLGTRYHLTQRKIRNLLDQLIRCSRTSNTCANIIKLRSALWIFTSDALVPTNNAAEQALRSLVLKRKISGPRRSLRGDQFLARGYTVHETCLRQGVDVWDFMHKAVHAFIAKTAPPSFMPQARPLAVVPTG
jgi:hypothetical protein